MSRLWHLLLVVLFAVLLRYGSSGAVPVDLGSCPVPAEEASEFLAGWLRHHGYAVSRHDYPGDWMIRLDTRKDGEAISVEIRPQSPLASLLQLSTPPGPTGTENPNVSLLRTALQEYRSQVARDSARDSLPLTSRHLSQQGTLYCIEASVRGSVVSFSGFAVDRSGLVVSTAHDLKGVGRVTLTGADGTELAGTVIRRDVRRDLTLIKVDAPLPKTVSLDDGRPALHAGETVYLPHCAGGTVEVGVVDGPPALVSGQPYWQVKIKVTPGTSGSPLFDEAGTFAGVVKGRYRGTQTRGFIIPVETVREFLRQVKR